MTNNKLPVTAPTHKQGFRARPTGKDRDSGQTLKIEYKIWSVSFLSLLCAFVCSLEQGQVEQGTGVVVQVWPIPIFMRTYLFLSLSSVSASRASPCSISNSPSSNRATNSGDTILNFRNFHFSFTVPSGRASAGIACSW